MKQLVLILAATCTISLALSGQGINYQAVVRDPSGAILPDRDVAFRFSYLPMSDSSSADYVETFEATTNEFGLVRLLLTTGVPQSGSSEDLDWGQDRYYLRTELDVDGGMDYELMGSELMGDVPYARYAPTEPGGGSDGGSRITSSCAANNSGVDVCAWLAGGAVTAVGGNGADGFVLSTTSSMDPLKIIVEGNSSTTTGDGDFFFTILRDNDSPVSYYQFQIFDLGNNQWADPAARGHILRQTLTDDGIFLEIPNIGGNYPNGFRLILN